MPFPIVFTSSAPAGGRPSADFGGPVLFGKVADNGPVGTGPAVQISGVLPVQSTGGPTNQVVSTGAINKAALIYASVSTASLVGAGPPAFRGFGAGMAYVDSTSPHIEIYSTAQAEWILIPSSTAGVVSSTGVIGEGTINTLPKWTSTSGALGDSRITDDASTITLPSDFVNIGVSNTLHGSFEQYALGQFNTVSTNVFSGTVFLIGDGNTATHNPAVAVGISNTINANGSYAFGDSNTVGGALAGGYGASNTVNSAASFVYGYLLTVTSSAGSDSFAFGGGGTITGVGGLYVGSGSVGGLGVGATISGAQSALYGVNGGVVTVSGQNSMGFIANDAAATNPDRVLSGNNSVLFWLDGPAFTLSDNNAFAIKGAHFQLRPVTTSAADTAEARWYELAANGTNYVGFKPADSISANVIWTLPTADKTGPMVSNGSAVLSLSSGASGTITSTTTVTVVNGVVTAIV